MLRRKLLLRSFSLHEAFFADRRLLLHVGGMVALRKLVYLLMNRHYEFGPLGVELVYEFLKDFRTYWSLIIIVYLYAFLPCHKSKSSAEFKKEGFHFPEDSILKVFFQIAVL